MTEIKRLYTCTQPSSCKLILTIDDKYEIWRFFYKDGKLRVFIVYDDLDTCAWLITHDLAEKELKSSFYLEHQQIIEISLIHMD